MQGILGIFMQETGNAKQEEITGETVLTVLKQFRSFLPNVLTDNKICVKAPKQSETFSVHFGASSHGRPNLAVRILLIFFKY